MRIDVLIAILSIIRQRLGEVPIKLPRRDTITLVNRSILNIDRKYLESALQVASEALITDAVNFDFRRISTLNIDEIYLISRN